MVDNIPSQLPDFYTRAAVSDQLISSESNVEPSVLLALKQKQQVRRETERRLGTKELELTSDYFTAVCETIITPDKTLQVNSVCNAGRSISFSFLQAHLCTTVIQRNKSIAFLLSPQFYWTFYLHQNKNNPLIGQTCVQFGTTQGRGLNKVNVGLTHTLTDKLDIKTMSTVSKNILRQFLGIHYRLGKEWSLDFGVVPHAKRHTVKEDGVTKDLGYRWNLHSIQARLSQRINSGHKSFWTPDKRSITYREPENHLQIEYKQSRTYQNCSLQFIQLLSILQQQSEEELQITVGSETSLLAKFKLSEQFKLYTGIQFGQDGLTALLGAKIAGIKLLFPLTGIEQFTNKQNQNDSFFYPFVIAVASLLAAKAFRSKEVKTKEEMLESWLQTELQQLWSRHLSILHMVRVDAQKKQQNSNVIVKGAYYGLKANIRKLIQLQIELANFERSSQVEQVEPFLDQQFVIDVTLPTRYLLEKEGLKIGFNKQSLLGFFNPIPPFMKEEEPTLCLVYAMRATETDVVIQYFNSKELVDL